MRSTLFAILLLPAACAQEPTVDSSDLSKRDEAMAKLMDRTTELENKVKELETREKLRPHTSTAVAIAPPVALPDFERDRLDKRVKDLERDAGKMPPP